MIDETRGGSDMPPPVDGPVPAPGEAAPSAAPAVPPSGAATASAAADAPSATATVATASAADAPTSAAVTATSAGGATASATPAPLDEPGAAEARGAHGEPELSTRLVGLGWLALSGLLVWFFAGRAFASDLGTENVNLRLVIRALAVALPGYPGALGLIALITGRQPSQRWNVLSLPFEGWWYSTLWTLTWREIKGFYGRPVAYLVLFVWLLSNGYFVVLVLDHYAGQESWGRDFQLPPSMYVTNHWLLIVSLGVIAPALTMRLLAEEAKTGSLEMLLTSPVTHAQVALSKYLGALSFYLSMLLSIGVYLVILRQFATEWDWGPVVSGYLGLLLMGAMFLSVGLFTSSVTDNQVVAFILAIVPLFAVIFGVLLLRNLLTFEGGRELVDQLNVWDHQQQFSKGIVQWRALAFYLSGTAFFLFLSVRGVESHTWR